MHMHIICVNVHYMYVYIHVCVMNTCMHTYMHTYVSQKQAYGAQKYHLVGNILQQSLLVVAASLIPISILWYCA